MTAESGAERDLPAHAGRGLHAVMRAAVRGTHADFALVALRVDSERLVVHAGIGPLAEDMVGNMMLISDSVAAPVLDRGESLLVADYPSNGAAAPAVRALIGSVIVVPLTTPTGIGGALAVGRLLEHPGFAPGDIGELEAFVRRGGVSREVEFAHENRRFARLMEERVRIRDDLHDHVIQEIFAAAMSLQAVLDRIADAGVRTMVSAQITALDATNARIRALISDLPGYAREVPGLPLPTRLLAIVDSVTGALQCLPTVRFAGPVDSSVDAEVAADLEAVLREALSNVARHAGATAVQIAVSVLDGRLVLEVADDGRGIGRPARRSGLANMERRALRHGGAVRVSDSPAGGTELRWEVPLRAEGRR